MCGDIEHSPECKERKSGTNDVNVVDVDETTKIVAHLDY